MADLKELKRLRDEERTLISLASLLTDQLNRLKVEELALLNKRRLQNTPANSHRTVSSMNEQEVYLAEEMHPEPVQHQSQQEQETIHMPSTSTTDLSFGNKENMHNTQIVEPEIHEVVPVNLTVNKHHQAVTMEIEEEEEED